MGRDGPHPGTGSELPAGAVLVAAYLAGAVPFAQLLARNRHGVDLRRHGTGTVSATGLGQVAGSAAVRASDRGKAPEATTRPRPRTRSR